MSAQKPASRVPGILFLLAIGVCVAGFAVAMFLSRQSPRRNVPVRQRQLDDSETARLKESLEQARQLHEKAQELLNTPETADQ